MENTNTNKNTRSILKKSNTPRGTAKHVRGLKESQMQKRCVPGPNVFFKNKQFILPLEEYLRNMRKKGSLGCGPNQYPKYMDYKYCCSDTMSTEQEKFDYINTLLQGMVDSLSPEFTQKNKEVVFALVRERQLMHDNMEEGEELNDILLLPTQYQDVNDWVDDMLEKAVLLQISYNPEEVETPQYIRDLRQNIPRENIPRTPRFIPNARKKVPGDDYFNDDDDESDTEEEEQFEMEFGGTVRRRKTKTNKRRTKTNKRRTITNKRKMKKTMKKRQRNK